MDRWPQMASICDSIQDAPSRNFGLETSHPGDFSPCLQYLQAHVYIIPLLSTRLSIHYSLITPQVNAIFSDNKNFTK
jgi:hypothetical protein